MLKIININQKILKGLIIYLNATKHYWNEFVLLQTQYNTVERIDNTAKTTAVRCRILFSYVNVLLKLLLETWFSEWFSSC